MKTYVQVPPPPPYDDRLPIGREDEACWDRGPRIGNEGVMYCYRPRGHTGYHEGHESWNQYGWAPLR